MNVIHTYNHNKDSLPHRYVDIKNDVQYMTVEIKLVLMFVGPCIILIVE